MGNCCGRESGNFQGEGRTLGPAPVNASTSSTNRRAVVPSKITSPQEGRTLGGSSQPLNKPATPREAAARAAEDRAGATQVKGKLARQLDTQKAQTQTGTLAQNARDNLAARDADAAASARQWN